ncbi:hypothetical protein BDZ94DRAFT_1276568 [Collybia nuda]|uniref:Tyrosine specific protein phosphatases domain-containing protein n=1 Tax=Collybia nuda TaxID=64659 RepID=A0A9P5XR90_9AGAR|nr:hypothetical protein BDZ94DRAFT_1276568 [Collybia nuda]
MATSLVEPGLSPHHVPRNVQQPLHPTTSFPVAPSPLELSAAQLAPLASQHHASDYNRFKFGTKGCPVPYLPLSIQLPDYFDELQRRQFRCSQDKSWWPCRKSGAPSAVVVLSSAGAQPQEAILLQEELQAAIAEPLNKTRQESYTAGAKRSFHSSIKTSSSHPINISPIVPPELLPIISSNIILASSFSLRPPPVVYEIPKLFALDRITLSSVRHSDPRGHRASDPYPTNSFVIGHLRTRPNIKNAFRNINVGLSGIDTNSGRGKSNYDTLLGMPPPTLLQRSASTDVPSATEFNTNTLHPNTSSISLSLSLALAEKPSVILPNIFSKSPKTVKHPTYSLFTSESRLDARSSELLTRNRGLDNRRHNSFPLTFPCIAPPRSSPQAPFTLGNLFLSSCPGKKVRLQGPVKGRSGVCRDLDMDIKRMKELGVRCIICCLDDQELEFLGAPWSEYEECAGNNGIDVLRIPMPEGLAPLTPASLNTHLTRLIDTYTARGIPMLVHCRGGVGRAGVVACCWIIKLGLCGWIETDAELSPSSLLPSSASYSKCVGAPGTSTGETCGDTKMGSGYNVVHLVERVIAVVRKRRSIKAVETYEQVKFLVEFVEYLKGGAIA